MNYTGKQSKQSVEPTQKVAQAPTVSVFADQRASTAMQLKQQQIMHAAHSPKVIQQMTAEEESIQGKFENEAPTQLHDAPAAKPNNTGLPDNLKSGIENLSGYSMDDVKVHFNSDKPAQLNAHAYAQGTDIHVAPGQEQHLPHEAWHVVQQKQGRVQATMQMKAGVPVNDDAGLENEADVMGNRALQMSVQTTKSLHFKDNLNISQRNVSGYTFQLATKIKHTVGTIPFSGKSFIVGKKMEATLDPDDAVTGSATTSENYLWMQYLRSTYRPSGVIRGHLLNHDLGGYGIPENLYPISSMANSEHSDKVEQNVKKALSDSHKSNKKEINYNVTVREVGATERPYENVFFDCDWTDKDGNKKTENIESHLQTQSGWAGHSGKNQSPAKWRHGKRRGEADVDNHLKTTKKIEIENTDAINNLGSKTAYDESRALSVAESAQDKQLIDDAAQIIREQIDALGSFLQDPNSNQIWTEGTKYLNALLKLYNEAVIKGDFSTFDVQKWDEIKNILNKITEERLFIEHGID